MMRPDSSTGSATGGADGAGTVLTKCTATVTRQLGKRATTAAQQRQMSQLADRLHGHRKRPRHDQERRQRRRRELARTAL
jgi:hypothetical protein